MAGSGHERSTSGGRRGNDGDRPRGEWRPRPIQAEPMPAEDTGITRTPAGWEAIIDHCGGHPHTCIPMECVPMQEAGKVPRPRSGPRQKPRHKPRLRYRPRHRPRRRLRPRLRTRLRPGQLPGQEKLPVLRAGIRMGHTGTISARTEPV